MQIQGHKVHKRGKKPTVTPGCLQLPLAVSEPSVLLTWFHRLTLPRSTPTDCKLFTKNVFFLLKFIFAKERSLHKRGKTTHRAELFALKIAFS